MAPSSPCGTRISSDSSSYPRFSGGPNSCSRQGGQLSSAVAGSDLSNSLVRSQIVTEGILAGNLVRQGCWTESIAVGGETFVREIAARTTRRQSVEIESL